jgi:hypothetical protein
LLAGNLGTLHSCENAGFSSAEPLKHRHSCSLVDLKAEQPHPASPSPPFPTSSFLPFLGPAAGGPSGPITMPQNSNCRQQESKHKARHAFFHQKSPGRSMSKKHWLQCGNEAARVGKLKVSCSPSLTWDSTPWVQAS